MKNLDLQYGNGFPFDNDVMLFMQDDYQSAIQGLAGIGGQGNFIVSGLVQQGNNVSSGWIYYNGEFLKFIGGVKDDNFYISESTQTKIYQDGQTHPAFITRVAKFGSGVNSIAFSALKRLPSLLDMQSLITSIINFETAVIIKGCAVSNVTSVPTALTISAGLVLIDDNVIITQGYAGAYPVWINSDGIFVNAQPGAGSYIKFDPYTSQDKASVIRRAVYRIGDVLMTVVLSDRFDNTGLGRWEMKGFALMNNANGTLDIRDRFPIGYEGRGVNPGGADNQWDNNYTIPGNKGGEKTHQLTADEMPSVRVKLFGEQLSTGALAVDGDVITNNGGTGGASGYQLTKSTAAEPTIGKSSAIGGGQVHNNIPPYMVLVFAQRINN